MFKTAVVLASIVALAAASCPNQCSGHGRCGEWDKCECFYRWMGNDCSQRMCKEGLAWVDGSQANPHSWAECSNKGICDRETGECVCYDQYDGAACERSVCPNDCSGHGTCEYIHELGDWDSTNWDYWKIQGCKCDGDWTGTDCSQRICPWGDDPLTIPTSLLGDEWTITITHNGSYAHTAEMNLEIVDLHGTTHRSRPFNHSNKVTGTLLSSADWENLLLDIPAIRAVTGTAVTETVADTTYTYVFQLVAPLRLTDLRVSWGDSCTVAGCYPLRAPMDPADGHDMLTVTKAITTNAETLAESAECSNRGICDYDTGMCQCFEGHYGLACQHQTVLV
eukprot:CAMPEP_0185578676 /NCGR_PEP_ID=MMETSP0434-20130131/13078_1 /TAXON_ID=626734 ORGANISM="Favella taraikaensis, Strain Fe Narragansett Bay" /NCGR_SAMPLE_ID=MMETSP0434 /ASSEMBLY_ACC=CAM_ASM_000379 /LENGTH=336 /DNA_ID=CAMNT_0028196531 /DNA_START=26 /DNA_END=1036 /DNA_ORIENTATION=-